MLSWKDIKKTGLILVSVNMYFLLITFFKYSMISLTLVFLFFVGLLGMGLNIVYRATSDNKNSPQ